MKKPSIKFFKVVRSILYLILLPWPLYALIPYWFFTIAWIKYSIILIVAVELALGVFLIVTMAKRLGTAKIWAKLLFAALCLSFIIYSITAVNYIILQF